MKNVVIGVVVAAALTACSAAGSAGGGPQVSQSAADAWPARWCDAQPGITREQLVAIMGPETDKSPTTMTWSAHQYQFNAFFDGSGAVKQLDINTHSLSKGEQAALKCDTVRTRATVARAAARAAAKPARTRLAGCALVTDAEMSEILGTRMVAAERGGGNTECNYTPASGISPTVKLTVDWGDGKVAMASAGMMAKLEPGLSSPYQGIGDQAVAVGPALMIRTGDDLVTLVLSGVSGAPAAARQVFDTAKPRM
jgi:hypothetical protein